MNQRLLDGIWVRVVGIAAGIAAVCGSIFFVPFQAQQVDPLAVKLYVGLTLACSLYCIEAVWLFRKGLVNFKASLRRAYLILCIALICLVVALLQVPAGGILGTLVWYNTGLANIPYLATATLLFVSVRMFAHLMGIRDRLTSLRWPVGLGVVAALATLLIPLHLSAVVPVALGFRTTLIAIAMAVVLVGCALINLYRLRRVMGAAYSNAMQWLLLAFAAHLVSELQIGALATVGFDNYYGLSGWYNLWYVVEGLLFVRAGYAFWRIGARVQTMDQASALDVVMYMAGLVTNPRSVEPALDRVRSITARLKPGAELSVRDQKVLASVYHELERYLVEEEPLRRFSRDSLQRRLDLMFRHGGEEHSVFWDMVLSA